MQENRKIVAAANSTLKLSEFLKMKSMKRSAEPWFSARLIITNAAIASATNARTAKARFFRNV